MHAPQWICEEIARKHKWLRLAWHGRDKAYDGELNPGSFALVQLYHIRDAGTDDSPNTYWQRWNPPGHHMGPIFSRKGTNERDWDVLTRVPIYAARFSDFNVSTRDVFSGKILEIIDEWLKPMKDRVARQRREMKAELASTAEDISREATDFLWHKASKTEETSVDVPWEFAKQDIEKLYRDLDTKDEQLKHYYDVPGLDD